MSPSPVGVGEERYVKRIMIHQLFIIYVLTLSPIFVLPLRLNDLCPGLLLLYTQVFRVSDPQKPKLYK